MRLFLGIEVPSEIKTLIASSIIPIQSTLKGWENPSDYHLTLLFIGESKTEQCEEIKDRMKAINFAPFLLETGQLSFFNRRILYLDFSPSSDLLMLKDQVENHFSEWLHPERKPFIPHLTLKRWQRYEYDKLHQSITEHPMRKMNFLVNRLALFKSEKDEFNRKYHVIKTHPE